MFRSLLVICTIADYASVVMLLVTVTTLPFMMAVQTRIVPAKVQKGAGYVLATNAALMMALMLFSYASTTTIVLLFFTGFVFAPFIAVALALYYGDWLDVAELALVALLAWAAFSSSAWCRKSWKERL